MIKQILLFLVSFLCLTSAFSHVPVSGADNTHLNSSELISEPTKSWAIYSELRGDVARYYYFDMTSKDSLVINLITPNKGFAPKLVIMTPNGGGINEAPENIEVPSGYDALLFSGIEPDSKDYEPFTPSSYYNILKLNLTLNSTGRYYIAVFDDTGFEDSDFGLAIGYVESFSLYEWVKIPFDTVTIHEWEGQSLLLVLAPFFITIIGGLNVFRRMLSFKNIPVTICVIGLLSYFGSATMTLMQMLIAFNRAAFTYGFLITLIFIFIPVFLGTLIAGVITKKVFNTADRIMLIIYGIIGIFTWSGFIIGPSLVILSGILLKIHKR